MKCGEGCRGKIGVMASRGRDEGRGDGSGLVGGDRSVGQQKLGQGEWGGPCINRERVLCTQ